MPYIKDDRREELLDNVGDERIRNPGELNFLITSICLNYLKTHGECYDAFNDIAGALENAKQEFYRRMVIPYEEQKIKENGDVYHGGNTGQ